MPHGITVLPATRQRWHSRPYPSRSWYSIKRPRMDARVDLSNDKAAPVLCNTHPFNGPFSGTTQVRLYQKGKTNLDFIEARDSEWQWHQLGRMQVCTSLQTDNHASTPPLSFLQAGCPSCRPTNSRSRYSIKRPRRDARLSVWGYCTVQCANRNWINFLSTGIM